MRWRWSTPGIRRYSDHVLDLFGPERVMAASNWPVILLGASYEEAWRGIIALSVASKSPPANACLPTAIAGLDRSILRALIRVVDYAVRPPLPERHLKGIEHELRVQGGRHRPADNPTAERIQHNRQVEEAGPGRNVRDISHPRQIGPIRSEVTVDEIGCLACAIPHRRDGALTTAHANQAGVPHQPGNTFATDANAGFRKINLQTRCSVRAVRSNVCPMDFGGQRGIGHGRF